MISTTNICFAEPLKKRKKVDIEVLKIRHERKIRKMEREIRRMKKTPRQLKPIEEYVLPPKIMKELDTRIRKNDEKEVELLQLNLKKMSRLWSEYKSVDRKLQKLNMTLVLKAQSEALEKLKEIDEELYLNAVAKDESMKLIVDDQIITETAPNPEYKTKDGKKTDVSQEWFM